MQTILIIDDDTDLCELLSELFARDGFVVESVHNGPDGVELALSGRHSLVVLDVMLPGLGGFDVLRRIREASRIPVVMLTARGDDIDKIVGLEIGADDYLPKPFNPRELLARIRAVLRRAEPGSPAQGDGSRISCADVTLVPGTRTAYCANQKLDLTSVEYTILELLLRQAGTVVNRDELVKQALGRDASVYDRSIDVHISSLRKKLGQKDDGPERIKTVRNIGYLYVSER